MSLRSEPIKQGGLNASYSKLIHIIIDSCGGSDGKESACNVGDQGSIPGSGRSSGEGNVNPLHYSCLECPVFLGESHGQRSLVGNSPLGLTQSDRTE